MVMWKPMLAGKIQPPFIVSPSRFPLLASNKLDGVRATVQNGRLYSRALKLIPNKYVQNVFGLPELNGLDGELILGDPTVPDAYRKTVSAVMTASGCPKVTFHVFDCFCQMPFEMRLELAGDMITAFSSGVIRVHHWEVMNPVHLLNLETLAVEAGYEGLMIRDPQGPYKQGRSTENEGWLLKLKRFEDAEAEVIGFEEQMHNDNAATVNELGHQTRSSHKENLKPAGVLGALIVRDVGTAVQFNVGTGFDEVERREIWKHREQCMGRLLKYKFYPSVKEKPRYPTWMGWRHPIDMDHL